jgi:hypothetical protein
MGKKEHELGEVEVYGVVLATGVVARTNVDEAPWWQK